MITGIILEIKDNKAVLLLNGGEFKTVPAKMGWKQGDMVTIQTTRIRSYQKLVTAIAACIAFVIFLSYSGNQLYFTETSMISIDINPSVEIGINRFDRVISVRPMNKQGEELTKNIQLNNMKYNAAIELLVSDDYIQSYLYKDGAVAFAIKSSDHKQTELMKAEVENTAGKKILSHHGVTQIEYYTVDQMLVEHAHSHGLTPGKYSLLLQLQELMEEEIIDTYKNSSISEIKEEIKKCGDHSDAVHEELKNNPDHNKTQEHHKND